MEHIVHKGLQVPQYVLMAATAQTQPSKFHAPQEDGAPQAPRMPYCVLILTLTRDQMARGRTTKTAVIGTALAPPRPLMGSVKPHSRSQSAVLQSAHLVSMSQTAVQQGMAPATAAQSCARKRGSTTAGVEEPATGPAYRAISKLHVYLVNT
jgi:hypothetical protein